MPEGVGGRRSREGLLCEWAVEEGFDRAGIATLEASEYGDEFSAWVERGDNASMEWLGRRVEERLNPASRLEGAKSAVCVALHYPARGQDESDLWSGVARYAHGDDYHDVMMRRLRRLGDRIERSYPGSRTRSYVDTGPLLERELGQRAGLGRIAKNTMLLSRSGSYFLLGEVLTTLDLSPGETLPDLCGNCTRCLDACPTDALTQPYRLDARRCISFWTIEHRTDLPEEIERDLGEWTFGCDICQQVCPWNEERNPRRSQAERASDLALPEHRRGLDLVELVTLDRDCYVETFRRSAMKRAKLDGLRRNAAAVLANEALALLQEGGSDERVMVIVSALVESVGQQSESGVGARAAARALIAIAESLASCCDPAGARNVLPPLLRERLRRAAQNASGTGTQQALESAWACWSVLESGAQSQPAEDL